MADEDYYSIQSILADNHVSLYEAPARNTGLMGQKLTCTFNLTVPGLGYLEGGTEEDVSRSAPIWIALKAF